MATARYSIQDDIISQNIIIGSKVVSSSSKNLDSFLQELSSQALFDTGLMPKGVRSYARHGDREQVVVVIEPGINRLQWGQHEGDNEAQSYMVAQPWQVVIIDFHKGNLLGARVFYSPIDIYTLHQPLYHANLSNINCLGYNDTSVGWICLYLNEDMTHMNLHQKISRIIERVCGEEVFNFDNMSETDGVKFYSRLADDVLVKDPERSKMLNVLSSPSYWEKYTDEYGLDWVLDVNLWEPIVVEKHDSQKSHRFVDDPSEREDLNFTILTLGMAMYSPYSAYYSDSPIYNSLSHARVGKKEYTSALSRVARVYSASSHEDGSVKLREQYEKEVASHPVNYLIDSADIPL